jgi:hypothetical protein
LYDQAATIYQQVGDRLGFANVLQEMGRMQTDLAQGLHLLEQAQAIYTQIQDRYSQSRNLLFIADVQRSLNQPDAALASLDRASILAAEIGYEPFQTYAATKRAELEAPPTQPEVNPTSSEVIPTQSEVNPTPSEVIPTPSEVRLTPSEVNPTSSEVNPTLSEVNPTPSEVRPTQSASYRLGQGFLGLGVIAFIGFNLINGHWVLALVLSLIGAIILWLFTSSRRR